MNAITTKDLNEAVEGVKARLIRKEVINSYLNNGYTYAQASSLFDLINSGMIKHVRINYGVKNDN